MARPRKSNTQHLPRYVHFRHNAYHFARDGKSTRLGANFADALAEYGKRMSCTIAASSAPSVTSSSAPSVAASSTTPDISVAELIERAFPIISKHVKPSTKSSWATRAERLKNSFHKNNVMLRDLRAKHVYAMKDEYAGHPATFNKLFLVLRTCVAWGVERELIESNPFSDIKMLKEGKRDRYIEHAEFEAIYAKANPMMQIIMQLCYRTGQRIGDVLHIELEQLTNEGIRFKQSKTSNKTLPGWSPELQKAVARAKEMRSNVEKLGEPRYLLAGRGGKPLPHQSVHRWWSQACKAAGVKDARIHDLRAKAASDIHADGGIAQAQALLGHSNSSMTQRYVRNRRVTVVQGPTGAKGAA